MKNSIKHKECNRKNEDSFRKSQKKEANLSKNTALYFQIGLIMCLLAAYGALEMKFEEHDFKLPDTATIALDEDYMFAPTIAIQPDAVETSEPVKKQPQPVIDPEIIPDDTPEKETSKKLESDIFTPTKPENSKPTVNPGDLEVYKIPEEVHVNFVDLVPVYPGCESASNNDQRRKCMSEKLSNLVQKKFDRDLGADLGLKEGIQRIYVNFRINKDGLVEIINTRATHKDLEEEANRVVDKVPQMTPGKQGGQPVSVLYSLPIIFQVKY